MTWLVRRIDADSKDMTPERWDLVKAWLVRHGIDVMDITARVTVTSEDDGQLRIHASRFQRLDGQKVADLNLDAMATTPLVVDINPADPPPWLVKE